VGLTNNGPSALNGNVTASGNLVAAGDVQGFTVHATAGITAGTNVSGSDIIASHNVTAVNDVSATHNVTAGNLVSSSGSITAVLDITATRDLLATRDVTATRQVTASTGAVWAGTQVWAQNGNVTANQGNLVATFDVTCRSVIASTTVSAGFIHSTGKMQVDGSFSGVDVAASGNVTAAYVSSTGDINATGTYKGGSVSVTLDIAGRNFAATGSISAQANIATVTDMGARTYYANTKFSGPYFESTGDMFVAYTYRGGNVNVVGAVQGSWVHSTGNMNVDVDLGVTRDAFIGRSINVTNSVGAGYVGSSGNIDAAGTHTGGAVNVSGNINGSSIGAALDLFAGRNADVGGQLAAGVLYSRGPVYVGNAADFYLTIIGADRRLNYMANHWWNFDNSGDLTWYKAGKPVIQLTYPRINGQEDGDLFLWSEGAWKYGGGPWISFSDARLKNIGDVYTGGLTQLRKLAPRRFHYRQDRAPKDVTVPPREFIGFSVEDLESVLPEAVVGDPKISDVRGVDTNPLFYAMLNAIKELDREVQDLRKQLAPKESPA
jgi:cytoskeletal protein CcmA (bactofilin family)